MTGQISGLPLELVVVVVAASMLVGAVDILRQPEWAWKQAGEPRIAYLLLDLLLPLLGLGLYVFRARPKVVAAVAAGAASPTRQTQDLPAKPASGPAGPEQITEPEPQKRAIASGTDPFTSFREVAGNGYGPAADAPSPEAPEQFAISSTFFSTGASTRSLRHPLALARGYRPRQRTSLSEDQPEPAPVAESEREIEPDQAELVEATGRSTGSLRLALTRKRGYRPRQRTSLSEDQPEPAPVAEREIEPDPVEPVQPVEATGPSTRGLRHALTRKRGYRPRQRTSLSEDQPEPAPAAERDPEPEPARQAQLIAPEPQPIPEPERAVGSEPEQITEPEPAAEPAPVMAIAEQAPSVPSGWKVDPTGRHQFRFWDGVHWTANVADNGQESYDAVSA